MADATSLVLPPGAMFSIMFTKHRILNCWHRQEESSATIEISLQAGRETLSVRKHVSDAVVSDNSSTDQTRSQQIARLSSDRDGGHRHRRRRLSADLVYVY